MTMRKEQQSRCKYLVNWFDVIKVFDYFNNQNLIFSEKGKARVTWQCKAASPK